MRRGTQATNTQPCINREWVESASNQWPQWTESHLIFLIQRFGLCSLSQDKITHLSIDTILQTTTIYLDTIGWQAKHDDRLWEKLNLKIGYLHAGLTGQRDQAMIDHHCKTRLYFHAMHKKKLLDLSSNRDSNPLSSPYRPRTIPAPTPTFQPAASAGRAASQYRPDVKPHPVGQAMELWMSMSNNEQANLLQSQLQTAKSFNNLVMIVDRRCKYVQASRARQTGHVSPITAGHPLVINTADLNTDTGKKTYTDANTLRLKTSLSPSATINQRAPQSASSTGGSSKSPDIIFDGLPSPTTTTEDRWSTTPFSANCSDKDTSHLQNMDNNVQEINENEFAEVVRSRGANESPAPSKPLDVKSIIDNCIQELTLKRKREKQTAEENRREREEAEEVDEDEDELDTIQAVEEGEFEERRKRCKIQVVI
ncbi:hypothetical protein DL98DRAFT_570968 [Cadophora sp. DSE1049]|nr:hypothetical protein DL98DRAFT_570968 [Cadophora sp. DSE1049]